MQAKGRFYLMLAIIGVLVIVIVVMLIGGDRLSTGLLMSQKKVGEEDCGRYLTVVGNDFRTVKDTVYSEMTDLGASKGQVDFTRDIMERDDFNTELYPRLKSNQDLQNYIEGLNDAPAWMTCDEDCGGGLGLGCVEVMGTSTCVTGGGGNIPTLPGPDDSGGGGFGGSITIRIYF